MYRLHMQEVRDGKMVVVLVGGSNGNHVLAADLGRRPEFEVRLVTRRPEKWSKTIKCREQRTTSDSVPFPVLPTWWVEYEGELDAIYHWDNVDQALQGAHMVLMICPVTAHKEVFGRLCDNLPDHPLMIGSAYAQGGLDWAAREVLRGNPKAKLVTLFGLKHYPYLCKLDEYGKRVSLYGRFPDLRAAVSPFKPHNVEAVKRFLDPMFGKDVTMLTDFIICTLGGSNQLLHPAICSQLFEGWQPGKVFDRHMLFYREVGPKAQDWLFDLAIREVPTLLWALDGVLNRNGDLRRQATYEVFSTLVSKLPTFCQPKSLLKIPLLWGLKYNVRLTKVKAPMISKDGGFVPNIESRFFTDDIAHGLCVMQGLAEILEVEMPQVLYLIRRMQEFMGKDYVSQLPDIRGRYLNGKDVAETSSPQAYGVHDVAGLLDLLHWDRDEVFAVDTSRMLAAEEPVEAKLVSKL
eukprot:TRINITY_DN12358_c1_g3_i10.p1 TRINITY_DN12358_c1_g3~~TRINITY_DN12358_c1_g3_i10.p1  ORF type:complete len:462 (+),score=79.28 TRINITY_DN12358_c1_g3_i10:1852-3237(+)